jgi:hypothetical protein
MEPPLEVGAASDGGSRPSVPHGRLLLLLAFAALALAAYGRSLGGPFIGDDFLYLVGNPYIKQPTLETLRAILDPLGPAASQTANYAPVHMLLLGATWQLFGSSTTGHHVVNVLLHALVSASLIALYVRSGVRPGLAVFGGALFLLHPANVEAVAWISQIKTIVSLGLAALALWLEPRRPGWAAAVFALALLTKISSAFALPVAAVWLWEGRPPGEPVPRRTRARWLAVWAAVLVLVMMPEFLAFERLGHATTPGAGDLATRARMVLAVAGRYLAMATTSWGVSGFQQPDPPGSWLDPWCLLGGAALLGAGLRAGLVLRRRADEAAWWIWAAAAFAPVSQVFPFVYPVADRYLYPMLPGLFGAGLLAFGPALDRALGAAPWRRVAAIGAGAAWLLAFGLHSAERAALWRSQAMIMIDAATHYPAGIQAQVMRAQGAARRGDVEATVAALRAARDRGFDNFMDIWRSPLFAGVSEDPRYTEVVREVAGVWISHVQGRKTLTPMELHTLGLAHAAREEWTQAVERLEQALAAGVPNQDSVRAELAEVRARQRRADREAAEEQTPARGGSADGPTPP